jgi:predicted HTH domain antitoxin
MSRQLIIDYDDDMLFNIRLSEQAFTEEARFLLAAKLYEQTKLSSGQAAKLCGKERLDFLLSLPRIGVSISNLQPEDADAEIAFARDD